MFELGWTRTVVKEVVLLSVLVERVGLVPHLSSCLIRNLAGFRCCHYLMESRLFVSLPLGPKGEILVEDLEADLDEDGLQLVSLDRLELAEHYSSDEFRYDPSR